MFLVCLSAVSGAAATEAYEAMVKRLQGGDFTVDFKALRLAYAASPQYAPVSTKGLGLRDQVQKALEEKRFDAALAYAERWLDVQYLNPFAHLGAAGAYDGQQQADKAAFHRRIADRLYESVCGPDEGQSLDRPCQVISTDEEIYYLVRHGFELGGRREATCANSVPCDIFEVREPQSDLLVDIHFDISLPLKFQQQAEPPQPATSAADNQND